MYQLVYERFAGGLLMFTILMLLSVVAVVAGMCRMQSGAAWARLLVLGGAMAAIVLAVIHFRASAKGTVDWQGVFTRNYEMAGRVVGEAVVQKYPGLPVVILLRPQSGVGGSLNEYETARVKGIEAGLGGDGQSQRVHLPWSEDMKDLYPDEVAYQVMMDSSTLRAALEKHCPGAGVVIVASDFRNIWQAPQALRGSFKLIAFDLESVTADSLVRAGLLDMAVVRSEDEVDFHNLPADPREAFARQYRVISH